MIMMNEEEQKYIYPVDELDKIIREMDMGIMPMIPDDMMAEVKLRIKEIKSELFDEDDEEDQDVIEHRRAVQEHLEKKRREATKHDILIIKLNDQQKADLKADMETSIVRPDPNSLYNMSDDELYSSEEYKVIRQKLSRIRNCYYRAEDYINAISILQEAIEYSLEHDYPWMSKADAIAAFNRGEIKFTYCRLPVLYSGYTTQIKDPAVLRGIVTGEITLKDRNDTDDIPKKRIPYNPVSCDYDVVGPNDYKRMVEMHNKGYDTPLSPAIKAKSTIYNRYVIPSNNMFAKKSLTDGNPTSFDWTKPGAGQDYYNLTHGKKTSTSDIINILYAENNNTLNNVMASNISSFLSSMKTCDHNNSRAVYNTDMISTSLQVNPQAAKIENDILNAIKANNPHI